MTQYGVTREGFVIKPIRDIIEAKLQRAREVFGDDVDLRVHSSLRKIIDITSAEDHEIWKRMERLYYANFISTASGDALDLLGQDIGIPRRGLLSSGTVTLQLNSPEPARQYHIPLGALVETDPPVRQFRTLDGVTLTDDEPEKDVAVEALIRGPDNDVNAQAINKINLEYAAGHLNLGSATIGVENASATTGGAEEESDDTYRDHMLGYPRTLWTLEAVSHTVKNVDGVRDCRLFDPLGGTDVSLSIFKLFAFNQRRFGVQRLLGSPYHFDILIALLPGFSWESSLTIRGVKERLEQEVKQVRPVSVFPNLRRANNVDIGIRARIAIPAGQDATGIVANIRDNLDRRINALGLGEAVLYSDVMCDCRVAAGVVDVQQLHLRRCPPQFGRVSIGRHLGFQSDVIEFGIGENIALQPVEIALFRTDSPLSEIEVIEQ